MKKDVDLVSCSRAGDVFHYIWAARRCLDMIHPNSIIKYIKIEGSSESDKRGEYSIDLSEYTTSKEGQHRITYFQMKHTTVRKEVHFNLSDLKKTFTGFANRFSDLLNQNEVKLEDVKFEIVTNRPFSDSIKKNLNAIKSNGKVGKNFLETIIKYTKLEGDELKKFCTLLIINDTEGDYSDQRNKLQIRLSQLTAKYVENPLIASIIDLVQKKVLPNSDGIIVPEEVFLLFGTTSKEALFPAPPLFEKLENIIHREQNTSIIENILKATSPIILHAEGGVGKSILAQQIPLLLPEDSLGIVYDCFGNGLYRNRNSMRHRYRDAIPQIVNEIACSELCEPLIVKNNDLDDQIIRKFLINIEDAIGNLRKLNKEAVLVIVIDAGDNAEMASTEFGDTCFVHEILKVPLPEGCKLVVLCRTERIELLKPRSTDIIIKIESFSVEESLKHLRTYFPNANELDVKEFHRLTNNGNPRVQAYGLSKGFGSLEELLSHFGPEGTTLEEQIENQLNSAIAKIEELLPKDFMNPINSICTGLASLPPHVPISVLSQTSQIEESYIKSFLSDFGHPLLLNENTVMFRDEPTEYWFKKYSGSIKQIKSYIEILKPFASQTSYISYALPLLYSQADMNKELMELALTEEELPDNPIDKRNVKVYRLKLAFKKALEEKNYPNAVKLSLLTGEEIAGDERQVELLTKNVDLIEPLLSKEKVLEYAFSRKLSGKWRGSEYVYSASLYSTVPEYLGDAKSYLRSANNCLELYFEERNKYKDNRMNDELEVQDIVEMAFCINNLSGLSEAVNFIQGCKPNYFVYSITCGLVKRFIDLGKLNIINELSAMAVQNPYIILALSYEILNVGMFPEKNVLEQCLSLLLKDLAQIPKFEHYDDNTFEAALISFLEICAKMKLTESLILEVLNYYYPVRVPNYYYLDRTLIKQRNVYLRTISLRLALSCKPRPDLGEILPEDLLEIYSKNKETHEVNEFKEIVFGLLPWYNLRLKVLLGKVEDVFAEISEANNLSRDAIKHIWSQNDFILFDISKVHFEILAYYQNSDQNVTLKIYEMFTKSADNIRLEDRFYALRMAFRLKHLSIIRKPLEDSLRSIVKSNLNKETNTIAENYINLARAVMPVCKDDARCYFKEAISFVSKFGYEILERWRAINALGLRVAKDGSVSYEIAYRFLRIAELAGDYIDSENSWNRNDAIATCVKLSPEFALAGLSRWRDRDVGYFYRMILALARELVQSKKVSPIVGWSLSTFLEDYNLIEFASICMENLELDSQRQQILSCTIKVLRLTDQPIEYWQKIKKIVQRFSIANAELDKILSIYDNTQTKKTEEPNSTVKLLSRVEDYDSEDNINLFKNKDLSSSEGINSIIRDNKSKNRNYYGNPFWTEYIKHISDGEVLSFLKNVVDADDVNKFDIQTIIQILPNEWKTKVSVEEYWNTFYESIGKKFALEFVNKMMLDSFCKDIKANTREKESINKGILQGLSIRENLFGASEYFGFVEFYSPFISSGDSFELFDFAMKRFETYIEDDFADGVWSEWLTPPNDIVKAFTGLIWACLGSPESKIRWQAAHCVRLLAEANSKQEINSLIDWMKDDKVNAFGSNRFPFYNLHARLYLLIALARVSKDYPEIVKDHFKIFSDLVLGEFKHSLIQKFVTEIVLNIEKSFPKTYTEDIVRQVTTSNISPFPKIKDKETDTKSRMTSKYDVNDSFKLYHGIDFDEYWFKPLASLFNLTINIVRNMATEVILDQWQIIPTGHHIKDLRSGIWTKYQYPKGTFYHHGSFPRTDDYSFYLSYHALLTVSARLFQTKPILHEDNWPYDTWEDWIHRFSLTQLDGLWLADIRDSIPLTSASFPLQNGLDLWLDEITIPKFLNSLTENRNCNIWFNAYGEWKETHNSCTESIIITSALVNPKTSEALLNALTTCENLYNAFLPQFAEKQDKNPHPFDLIGWIYRNDSDRRLDDFDPFAGKITYPLYKFGDNIVNKLQLLFDSASKEWHFSTGNTKFAYNEIWCSNIENPSDSPKRDGNRLVVSIDFLKKVCKDMKCEIIFDIRIRRSSEYDKRKKEDNNDSYGIPKQRIFIFSADGRLRSTEANNHLGEIIG